MHAKNERCSFLYLFVIMVIVSTCVGGSIIIILYNTSFELQRERLIEMAKSQARLIEAVARFDNNATSTLSQIIDAHHHYKGFGKTGEFTLAKLEEDKIVFLLSHRHYDLTNPKPVPLSSELAEPMRRALLGQSGTIVGKDYRGETVLAAFEAVKELHYGIVAKIDHSEILKPFIHAGITASVIIFFLVVLGALLFFRISKPILKNLEQKNKRLHQEIVTRTQAQEQLASSLEEKNILLKEIHHRVKNNMAMVSSLLHLQALEIENPNDRKRFIDTQNRIYTMALIHERLYNTNDFSKIDFNSFIQELSDSIRLSYNTSSCQVALALETNDVLLDLNKAVPCGLLINELISNSFKHAFAEKEQGKIDIQFRTTVDNHFELIVSDDGIGLPKNFNVNKEQSMGMQLISRLTEQLDGTVTVNKETLLETGTRFTIIF
ncbi:MAG: hypothetical protein D3924_09065 [Candidatus Electrothrix sp. AR4]|nr:hypothetical protein [Candidatus Electrothrix sp. AR4]